MMSVRLVFCAALFLVVAAKSVRERREEKYTTKYDNIDLDEILRSDRLLNNYINCMLEKGKCTPDGLELRNNIPDALHNECNKCSEKQRVGAQKVLRFMINNKKASYAELEKKYDPTGTYRKKYEKEVKDLEQSSKKS